MSEGLGSTTVPSPILLCKCLVILVTLVVPTWRRGIVAELELVRAMLGQFDRAFGGDDTSGEPDEGGSTGTGN